MGVKRVDGFFYGLFMDAALLSDFGVHGENPRMAYVDGFSLRIGERATLVPEAGARAYGMVFALTHDELNVLYGGPGLENYRPEAVQVSVISGGTMPALCFNLLDEPDAHESNAAYAEKLRDALGRLGFPDDYIATVH